MPGSFRWSETSVRSSESRTETLCTSRTPGTREGGRRSPLAELLCLGRLDVDDDVGAWHRTLDRILDGVGGCVALPNGGAGGTPMTTSAK